MLREEVEAEAVQIVLNGLQAQKVLVGETPSAIPALTAALA